MGVQAFTVSSDLAKTKSIDLASVDANTSALQDVTVEGVAKNRLYAIVFEALDAGLAVESVARGKDADTLEVRVQNSTGGAINPGSLTLHIIAL